MNTAYPQPASIMDTNILFPWQQESLIRHSQNILNSFKNWTGHSLLEANGSSAYLAQALFEAPFPVFSHGMNPTPFTTMATRKLWNCGNWIGSN